MSVRGPARDHQGPGGSGGLSDEELVGNMMALDAGLHRIEDAFSEHVLLAYEDPVTFGAGHFVLYPPEGSSPRFVIEEQYPPGVDWSDDDRVPTSWAWTAEARQRQPNGTRLGVPRRRRDGLGRLRRLPGISRKGGQDGPRPCGPGRSTHPGAAGQPGEMRTVGGAPPQHDPQSTCCPLLSCMGAIILGGDGADYSHTVANARRGPRHPASTTRKPVVTLRCCRSPLEAVSADAAGRDHRER